MNRRNVIHLSAVYIVAFLTGCQKSNQIDSTTKGHTKSMDISPTVQKTPNGWELEVIVANEDDWDASFHDIRLLAYAVNGTKACEADVGDLTPAGEFQRTVKTMCSAFPAIITATTQDTPCENALIPVLSWTGTETQRKQTVDADEWPWNTTYRKCGEDLPPQRVLDTFKTSSEEKG